MEIKYNNTHAAWSAPHFYPDAWGQIFILDEYGRAHRRPDTRSFACWPERKTKRKFNQMRRLLLGVLLKNAAARKDFLCPLPLAARATQSTSYGKGKLVQVLLPHRLTHYFCVCECFPRFASNRTNQKCVNREQKLASRACPGKLDPLMLCRQTWHQHLEPAQVSFYCHWMTFLREIRGFACARGWRRPLLVCFLFLHQQIAHGVACKLERNVVCL